MSSRLLSRIMFSFCTFHYKRTAANRDGIKNNMQIVKNGLSVR